MSDYYEWREHVEREAAENASCPEAAQAHLALSDLYRGRRLAGEPTEAARDDAILGIPHVRIIRS
jgi:hypothetical protein